LRHAPEFFVKRVVGLVVLAALAGTAIVSTRPEAQTRRAVTIVSGAVDGVYYPIAGAISRITSEDKALNIRATVESSAGSVANVRRIRSGEVDFALLQNDIAYYAFNGITLESFVGKPVKSISGVFSVYPELIHIVVTHESGTISRASASVSAPPARRRSRTRCRSSPPTGSCSATSGRPFVAHFPGWPTS
jgi:TRAP transporter TAXI family solute receptor